MEDKKTAGRVPLLTARGRLKGAPQSDTYKEKTYFQHMIIDDGDFFDDRIIVVSARELTQADFDSGVPVRYVGEYRGVQKFMEKTQ